MTESMDIIQESHLATYINRFPYLQKPYGRKTTWEEQATWGTCTVCESGPGEWCKTESGAQISMATEGKRFKTGDVAHLLRILDAPKQISVLRVSDAGYVKAPFTLDA